MNDEIVEHLKELLRTHPLHSHSPYYSNPCSSTCPVCNMERGLYDTIKESLDTDARYEQYLILRKEFENDNGRITPNKEGL